MFAVRAHLLYGNGALVPQRPSPNHNAVILPRLVVIHYTGDNNLAGALHWLCTPQSGVSAHLVIARDGAVFQLLPLNLRGWHAGVSAWQGHPGVNGFAIGVENVGGGDFWPEAQVEANRAVVAALAAAYPLEAVVGHTDVALPPGRKVDPGPLYPWERVRGTAAPVAAVLRLTRPMMRGERIFDLQCRLNHLGYLDNNQTDWIYGPITAAAVQEFQKNRGLPETGEADAVTAAKLGIKL